MRPILLLASTHDEQLSNQAKKIIQGHFNQPSPKGQRMLCRAI